MDPSSDWTQIGPESKVNDVMARYPTMGPVLVQMGRGYVNRRGDLYAQFPDLSVAQYAELNGLDTDAVVRRLQAEAEADAMTPKRTGSAQAIEDGPTLRRLPLAIGYTSSYEEREAGGPGSVPLTLVHPERGPE
jgi:hypothetical protein